MLPDSGQGSHGLRRKSNPLVIPRRKSAKIKNAPVATGAFFSLWPLGGPCDRCHHGTPFGHFSQWSLGAEMARCDECGYLAIRDEQGHGALEVNKQVRKIGHGKNKQASLFCYLSSPAFTGAIHEITDCDKVTRWLEGRTPKEHEDMTALEKATALYTSAARSMDEIQRRLAEANDANEKRMSDIETRERRRETKDAKWRWATLLVVALSMAGTVWNAYTNYSRTPTEEHKTNSVEAISLPSR